MTNHLTSHAHMVSREGPWYMGVWVEYGKFRVPDPFFLVIFSVKKVISLLSRGQRKFATKSQYFCVGFVVPMTKKCKNACFRFSRKYGLKLGLFIW